MKTCTKCGETKPFEAFSRHRCMRDGLRARCKRCCCDDVKAWRAANPEKARAHDAAWYAANRDKSNTRSAARYAANRAEECAKKAAWRAANLEEARETIRKGRAELRPAYVAVCLGMHVKDLTPELLALKREQLETHRLAKMAKQHLKEIENETSTDSE